ncbi:MAG: TolC family protein [Proteobacteria bacterium]|nr:TolC family protein [Pseudomonadota bacterium]
MSSDRAQPRRAARRLVAASLLLALAGCATYRPLPLPAAPGLAPSLAALRHTGVATDRPLTVADVAYLAVQNDPVLRAARARLGVARAEVLAAGVLPNPSLSAGLTPVIGGPGTTTGWSVGLGADLQALVTLHARRRAARAAAGGVNASLLWQEWQVIGQARLLAVDLMEGARLRRLIDQSRDLLARRYALTRRAVAEGNASLAVISPDLAALTGIEQQSDALGRVQQQRRHQLAGLLGLQPSVPLPLAATPDLPPVPASVVRRLLPGIAARRPDLIALRLGYRAADAKLRAAILAQFPRLTVGLTGASDTTGVRTLGPQITLDLPVFDRNQGPIAIARATRRRLRADYLARLDTAVGDVRAMLADTALLRRQLGRARRQLAETRRVADAAGAAFRAGNLTERAYVDFVTARIAKEQEVLGLEQSLAEQQVAMATLIGAGMPTVRLPALERAATEAGS